MAKMAAENDRLWEAIYMEHLEELRLKKAERVSV